MRVKICHCIYASLNEQDATGEVARLLIQAYPEALHTKGSDGWLPLHNSAAYGTITAVRVVLGAYPEAAKQPNNKGNLPLHLCCSSNEHDDTGEVVHLLLSQFAVTHRNHEDEVAFDASHKRGLKDSTIELLFQSMDWSLLMFAAARRNLQEVICCLRSNVSDPWLQCKGERSTAAMAIAWPQIERFSIGAMEPHMGLSAWLALTMSGASHRVKPCWKPFGFRCNGAKRHTSSIPTISDMECGVCAC